MKKIFIFVASALAVCALAFAGCGNDNRNADNTAPDNAVQQEQTVDGSNEEPVEEPASDDKNELPEYSRRDPHIYRKKPGKHGDLPNPCPMPRCHK